MKRKLSIFLVVATLFTTCFASAETNNDGIKSQDYTYSIDGEKASYKITDNEDKRIVTLSSKNKTDSTVVLNKSTGEISLDGEVIAHVESADENSKKISTDSTYSIASGTSWSSTPFYGKSSDYTKYLGKYRNNVALSEAAINGGRAVVIAVLIAACGITGWTGGLIFSIVANEIISRALPYVYYENKKYQHKSLPGYWKNNFQYYRNSDFTSPIGDNTVVYSTSW
ncbi:MAG: hypothetical protein ACOYVK_21695 [Bacillota bacterium]